MLVKFCDFPSSISIVESLFVWLCIDFDSIRMLRPSQCHPENHMYATVEYHAAWCIKNHPVLFESMQECRIRFAGGLCISGFAEHVYLGKFAASIGSQNLNSVVRGPFKMTNNV